MQHTQYVCVAIAVLSALASNAERPADVAMRINYNSYSRVLSSFVNEDGLVDYAGLASDPTDLNTFVGHLAALDASSFSRWPRADQMALWINAYNALTLKAVVDHFPIKSIKEIGSVFTSVWDKLEFDVMGRRVTLNQIEHEILRKQFSDPRIHLAINCASMGCPSLAGEPILSDAMDRQFSDLTARFLSDPRKFRIHRASGTVYLSPIFKWFGEDFVEAYGSTPARPDIAVAENAVLNFISDHLPEEDRLYLNSASVKVKYLGYDWRLNRQ